MTKLRMNALILIAAWAGNTWASGTNVYKCGSTYSQTPCDSAPPVRVGDSRSQDQKAQSQALAKQQAQTANTLEKTRLKEDAQALAEARKANAKAAAQANKKATPETGVADKPVVLSAPKSKGKSKKETEYFTAKAGGIPAKASSAPGK